MVSKGKRWRVKSGFETVTFCTTQTLFRALNVSVDSCSNPQITSTRRMAEEGGLEWESPKLEALGSRTKSSMLADIEVR